MTVWRLKATGGHGWVRQVLDGRPIVTADVDEAEEFPSRDAAIGALGDLAGWRPVEGEATPGGRRFHGPP